MKRKSRMLKLGNIELGGNNPIAVQSMIMCDPININESLRQIHLLENAACDLVRVAIPTIESARALGEIKKNISIPLVADIHFDSELAIEAIKQGADKIRLNPSNIRNSQKIREVVACAKDYKVAIRIGANEGSLKTAERGYSSPAKALFEAVRSELELLEKMSFEYIVLSAKASDLKTNQEVNRLLANHFDYPLHIGVTEAGLPSQGIVKTTLGLGPLLMEGIGDTLRFSLSGSLEDEIFAGKSLLRYLGLEHSVEVIACPTCGRCRWDVASVAKIVSIAVSRLKINATIAVMGCEVNGPGEAAGADFGLAGAGKKVLFFEKGKCIASGNQTEMLNVLMEKLHAWTLS